MDSAWSTSTARRVSTTAVDKAYIRTLGVIFLLALSLYFRFHGDDRRLQPFSFLLCKKNICRTYFRSLAVTKLSTSAACKLFDVQFSGSSFLPQHAAGAPYPPPGKRLDKRPLVRQTHHSTPSLK
jgi:hypothetical protein